MDLGQLTPTDEGARMVLKDFSAKPFRDDQGEPIWILLAGRNSYRWRKAEQAATNRRIEAAFIKKGNSKVNAEQIDADEIEKHIAVTLGWHPQLTYNGAILQFSEQNVRKLYSEVPAVFEQAQQFVFNPENFMKGGDGS